MKIKQIIQYLKKDIIRNKYIYIMLLPVVAYYAIFHYGPMYGAVIAFKDFSPALGIHGSPWVGLKHFQDFLGSYYFGRIITNTILLSLYSIIFGFPAPILLALLLNEVAWPPYKRAVQTITYLPHFISIVVVCGLIVNFVSTHGVINDIIVALGGKRLNLLNNPKLFRTIYVVSGIWQEVGWGSIIYLASLSNIDLNLYEAATIDGANRFKKALYITIPGIMDTVIILLILRLGRLMSVGSEKILLLYNPSIYSTADVISTFVYRKGLLEFSYSYSTAVGLFNSIINCLILVAANNLSRKINGKSMW